MKTHDYVFSFENSFQSSFWSVLNSSARVHLDIGGEGRYSDAINLNPLSYTTTTGVSGQPIPNHFLGFGDSIPFGGARISYISIENTPISPRMIDEVKRVWIPDGKIVLSHPDDYATKVHSVLACAVNGQFVQTRALGQTVTWITRVRD